MKRAIVLGLVCLSWLAVLAPGIAQAQPVGVYWRPPSGCSASQAIVWNGSAWTCGTVSSFSTSNVIPKGNGTGLTASSWTDDGTASTTTGILNVGTAASGPELVNFNHATRTVLRFLNNGTHSGYIGSANALFSGGAASTIGVYSVGALYLGGDDNATADLTLSGGHGTFSGNATVNGSLTSGDGAGDVFDHNGDLAKFGSGDGTIFLDNGSGLGFAYSTNATSTGYVNYAGYQNGATQFRNLIIADGKNATVATFTGADKSLAVVGNLSTEANLTAGNATTDAHAFTGRVTASETVGALFTDIDGSASIYAVDDTAFAAGVGGGILFLGKYTAGSPAGAAGVKAMKTNGTDGNYSFDLAFGTRANGGSVAEAMRIKDDGDVLIGEDAASGTIQGATQLLVSKASGDTAISAQTRSEDRDVFMAVEDTNNKAIIGTSVSQPLEFRTDNTARMRITSTGEVVMSSGTIADTTNGIHFGFSSNVGTISAIQPGTAYRPLFLDGADLNFSISGTAVGAFNSSGQLLLGDTGATAIGSNLDVVTVGNTGTGQTTSDTSVINAAHSGTFNIDSADKTAVGVRSTMTDKMVSTSSNKILTNIAGRFEATHDAAYGAKNYGVYAVATVGDSAGCSFNCSSTAGASHAYAIYATATGTNPAVYSAWFDQGTFLVTGPVQLWGSGVDVTGTLEVDGAINGYTQITQAADQDVTNLGVTDSNTFSITTAAGKSYLIEGLISAGGNNTTGDYLFDWAVAAGTMDCSGTAQHLNGSDAATNTAIVATAAADTGDVTVGTRADASIGIATRFHLACKVSNTTTLKYRFGNAAASGGRTSRTKAGSYIRWKQLD